MTAALDQPHITRMMRSPVDKRFYMGMRREME
jgi:hypothetical protein